MDLKKVRGQVDNILTSICITLDSYGGNSNIPPFQSNIPPLPTRITDLMEKIGVGYFAFDSYIPLSLDQKKKSTLQYLQPTSKQEEEDPA